MAKLADILVLAKNEHNSAISHEARYPCSVDSRGIFRADVPEELHPLFAGICAEHRDLGCKVETAKVRGGGFRHVVAGATLRNVERVLHLYGKSIVEADVRSELRIFYTLRLGAAFYRMPDGAILPNGRSDPNYGTSGGQWFGEKAPGFAGREEGGHVVGVGASVVEVTTVTPRNGEPAVSYGRVDDHDPRIGEMGRQLKEWTGQPWPSASRGAASKMRSVPYDETAAKLFVDVLQGLSRIAYMVEANLRDDEALPALLASGNLRLLGGPTG